MRNGRDASVTVYENKGLEGVTAENIAAENTWVRRPRGCCLIVEPFIYIIDCRICEKKLSLYMRIFTKMTQVMFFMQKWLFETFK